MQLDKQVDVVSRFQRSVRIDTDLDSPSALDGFLCTHSFARALRTLAESLKATGHGAYTWTGPYGGGKSVLLLALASLIGQRGRSRTIAEQAVGDEVGGEVRSAFRPGNRGWITLPIVGARAPGHALIWEAMRAGRLVQAKPNQKCPTPREVIQAVVRVSQRETHSGLLIAIDELGKVLEGAASTNGDLNFLQDLAEFASRSQGRLIFVGVLHQSFEEYAVRLGKQARDEWAKVQGRFIDIPLAPSSAEQLELLARAICSRGAPKTHEELSQSVAAALRRYRTDVRSDTAAVLRRCWPLHPVTACLLGPISRRRFGQNQRSLFAFLNSREPAGFQDFLRNATTHELYEPEQLFDYLRVNLEPAILASPDGHRWSLAIDALERAEKRGGGKIELALLRAIALLDLFRERSGLFATREVLHTLVPQITDKSLDAALEKLHQWSVVAYREHLSAYAIYAGSDFDLQAALEQAKETVKELDLKALRQIANLRPIVAKRHYHETGAFRWFDVDVVSSVALGEKVRQFAPNGAMGQILVVVPGMEDNDKSLRALAEKVSLGSTHPCLVGVCVAGSRVPELTSELLELEHIRANHPQLRDDMVARREVDARSATAAHLLEGEIRIAFATARFFYQGNKTEIQGLPELTRHASEIADTVYCDSPRIISELLNRSAPSSNAVAAQKALLRAMVTQPNAAYLGVQGFPPERGLYDCTLGATGLHVSDGTQAHFREPDQNDAGRLQALWKATEKFLQSAAQAPISAADVYGMFAAPPFGVRSGLRALLLVAYLQSRSERYTIYVDGVMQSALSDFGVDRLTMEPSSVTVRVFDPNERQRQLIKGVCATLMRIKTDPPIDEHADATALARAMVSVVRSQPAYVLRTMRMSEPAAAVRAALRAASDPYVLLHETVPATLERLLGKVNAPLSEELSLLDAALVEIGQTYARMLQRVDETLRTELGVAAGVDGEVELHHRAEQVRGLTGDLRLEAFANRLLSYHSDVSTIEGIASLAANKPARDWSDNDFDAALLELTVLAHRFHRAEAFARVKGRPNGRHAISIVVGLDRTPRLLSRDFEITERERREVLDIARQISRLGRGAKAEVVLAALAQVGSELISSESEPTAKAI